MVAVLLGKLAGLGPDHRSAIGRMVETIVGFIDGRPDALVELTLDGPADGLILGTVGGLTDGASTKSSAFI